jgi:hypothetical protein
MQVVKLISFAPFKNAAHALDEVNAISEAVLTDDLKNFLEVNLPKVRRGIHDAISKPCVESSRSTPKSFHTQMLYCLHMIFCLSISQALPHQAVQVMLLTASASLCKSRDCDCMYISHKSMQVSGMPKSNTQFSAAL